MMFNKRGEGLTVNTIIYIILGLLVLILVILIFTGQAGPIFESVKNYSQEILGTKPNFSELVK